jgi:prepilin-type N-terminal cleavage/methylation domain-containing protein/prepilin-type processing-associated H-X9-DG protein
MKKHVQTQQSGFTLLELLVVIAIIAVLSALMIPSIAGMHEKARMVQCINNLKQLHTAASNFSSDNGGYLPYPATENWLTMRANGRTSSGHHTGWVDWVSDSNPQTLWWNEDATNGTECIRNGALFNYLGNNGDEVIYICPSMARLAKKKYKNDEHALITRSYGMNASLESGIQAQKYYGVKGASRVIMFAEQGFEKQPGYKYGLTDTGGNWADNEFEDDPDPGSYVKRSYRNFDACIDWRGEVDNQTDAGSSKYEHIGEYHNGRGHAVFCDGHVERIEYDNTRYICSGNWDDHKAIPPTTPIKDW